MSDDRFFGKYCGKQAHKSDFDQCIQRARAFGVTHYLFAAGYIEDAKISLDLCNKTENSFATIGIHPCRATEPRILAKLPKEDVTAEQDDIALSDYIQKIDEIIAADQ